MKYLLKKLNAPIDNVEQIVTFINPHSYLLLRKQDVFEKFDKIYIDGISLVKLFNLFGFKVSRLSFDMTSLAPLVFNKCIEQNQSIYFIGAKEPEILNFIETIKIEFKNLNIVGSRNGYFTSLNQMEKCIDDIISLNPSVLVVGMGTPNQELFLIKVKEKGYKGVGYTCGGFFHHTAKKLNYYPIFFNKLNLRWLYRMYDEPKLIKRYFIYYPKAFIYLLIDLIKIKIN